MANAAQSNGDRWQKTACILCSENCGLEVQTEGDRIVKVKGDKDHPSSQGYACQKAQRLNYYQNSGRRLTSPLRRRDDGSFEEIDWDTAIREIAEKFGAIRDEHGGDTIVYYGGGGQGNHMAAPYASAFRAALGTRYVYTSLAQEKTGGFWVDGKLFGKQNCHPCEDVEHADYLIVIGANPWQSHGFPQARTVIQAIVKDPNRKMVVVDPRRTESAEKADLHLQVRPGGDAHFMLAMLGTIIQEGLEDKEFIAKWTVDFDELRDLLQSIPVDDYSREAGLDPETVRSVAREYASTEKACIRTDLGLEHSLHSTLNTYLSKLLYLVTGHFGKPGTQNFHTSIMPLISHSKEPEEGAIVTNVTGMKPIAGMYPPNILPKEILADHPKRVRGMYVDSSNPAMTGADSKAYREAFKKLDLLVVVDVALTETARAAHYVLPASSQFEKWEATFFNLDFPKNTFHLRRPIFRPMKNTLPEPEIYRRLVAAMGKIPDRFPLLEAIAKIDRRMPALRLYPLALGAALVMKPAWKRYAPAVLYATLGRALPDGADSAAVLWFAAHELAKTRSEDIERAGIRDEGAGLGEALFNAILNSPSGVVMTESTYEGVMDQLQHEDKKIHLAIPQMFDEIHALADETGDDEYPIVLMAGERRSYNANTIYRDEEWRKKDKEGALKVHPDDAARLGLSDGERARCTSKKGFVEAHVQISDELKPGVMSLPHGYGMNHGTDEDTGASANELTDADWCDELAKTPFHKFVRVRVEALVPEVIA